MSWHAYVYCHKNKGNNYTTIENRTLYHGQLIYFRNNGDGLEIMQQISFIMHLIIKVLRLRDYRLKQVMVIPMEILFMV